MQLNLRYDINSPPFGAPHPARLRDAGVLELAVRGPTWKGRTWALIQ